MANELHALALRDNRHLARFIIEGVPTGRQLGTGSYGSVEEIQVGGLLCAGKKLHSILLGAGIQEITDKYLQECQLMSNLRHPNIVQFLGICFMQDTFLPLLVMEKLEESLHDLLDSVPNIPLILKRSMLEDIVRGLHYLHVHDPIIIHRDLTAKNVLLTSSLVAKISDLGNSRMVRLQPGQLVQTLSRYPGTLVYMPPEALDASARYGPSLDMFSFGHLALFTLTQVFPGTLLEVLGHNELERRREYFQLLQPSLSVSNEVLHQFESMISRCLDNNLSQRPNAQQVLVFLEQIGINTDGRHGDIVKMDAIRHVVMMKKLHKMDTEFQRTRELHDVLLGGKDEELREKDEEIARMGHEIREKSATLRNKDAQLQEKDALLLRRNEELQAMNTLLQERNTQLQERETQIEGKDSLLSEAELQLQQKTRLLQQYEAELADFRRDLREKSTMLQIKNAELAETQELLHQFQTVNSRLQDQLDAQSDAEVLGRTAAIVDEVQRVARRTSRTLQQRKTVRVAVNIVIGHSASWREKVTPEGYTHDWILYVKGRDQNDISPIVKKVVFHLHKSFPKSRIEWMKTPYELSQSGFGSFTCGIEFQFHNDTSANISYDLDLPSQDNSPLENSESGHFTFENPSEDFYRRLILAGGCMLTNSNNGKDTQGSIVSKKRATTAKRKAQRKKLSGVKMKRMISSDSDSTSDESDASDKSWTDYIGLN